MPNELVIETKVVSTKIEKQLKWFSDKTRKFLNSNWSFVFFISFFVLITIAQLLYDGLSGTLMENKQLELDLIIFAGSISTIISLIYSARVKARFFVFMSFGLIFWIWSSIITDLPLNAIKLVILFIPSILRFTKWSKGGKTNNEIEIKRFKTWQFSIFLIIMIILTFIFGGLAKNLKHESLPYIDVGSFLFGVMAASVVAFGYIEGWFLTVLSFTFGLMSYVFLAVKDIRPLSISGIGSTLIFIILNIGTTLSWLSIYHSRNHTFRYIPKAKKA